MITNKTPEQPNNLVDRAALSADNAIKSTQRMANDTLDSLAGTVQDVRLEVAPLLNRASEQAGELARRGVAAVRDRSQLVRDKAVHATDSATLYIRDEPLKAMLIAAATGAALMALVGLLTRSRA